MKIKQPAILIVDSCNNPLAYYGIRSLKEASSKFKIHLLVSTEPESNNREWLYFYKSSRYVDHVVFSEAQMNSVDYLNDVIKTIETKGIDIVFPASEESFKFVSKYRDNLSHFCKIVALPSNDTLQTAFDKWKLHLFLKKHDIPTPETILLRDPEQLSQFNCPVLLKPIDGSGGKNIQKFDALTKENFPVILNHPTSETYIVQKYIDGYDMGCNVLCRHGEILAYTIQQQLGATVGFAAKIDKLKFVHDSAVLDLVTKTMSALQWSGIANLDLRYNSKTGEMNLLEINPRFWQSMMGSLSAGVNFPYLLYLLSNDISFEPVSYQEKYYAKFSRFIKDCLTGSLEYSLSDTNFIYFFSETISIMKFMFHRSLSHKLLVSKNTNALKHHEIKQG